MEIEDFNVNRLRNGGRNSDFETKNLVSQVSILQNQMKLLQDKLENINIKSEISYSYVLPRRELQKRVVQMFGQEILTPNPTMRIPISDMRDELINYAEKRFVLIGWHEIRSLLKEVWNIEYKQSNGVSYYDGVMFRTINDENNKGNNSPPPIVSK